MEEMKVGLFRKLLIDIKKNLSDEDDVKKMEEIACLISVSLYYDNKVTEAEKNRSFEIVDEVWINEKSVANTVKDLIKINLENYSEKSNAWKFNKHKKDILEKIFSTKNYRYAKFMCEIFKADKVEDEELEIYDRLLTIVDEHETLLKEKGILN